MGNIFALRRCSSTVERVSRKDEVEGSIPSIGFVEINQKYNSLQQILRSLGKVVIAYSGGVDSTFLLKAAVNTIGTENIICCLGVSGSLAQSQYRIALEMAEKIGIEIRRVKIDELEDENYSANKADRCFHCKSHLFGILKKIAKDEGIDNVICGSNFDDLDDYRPGNRAAKELGVTAPLMDAKMTKDDIRRLSKEFGLKTADMPATPCLASRISYGIEITEEKLNQIDQAEDFLKKLGFQELRVRHHGTLARLEVHVDAIPEVLKKRTAIIEKLKSFGFNYISLDLEGFRSGSMNEDLSTQEKNKNL